jgi:hypothetical protein
MTETCDSAMPRLARSALTERTVTGRRSPPAPAPDVPADGTSCAPAGALLPLGPPAQSVASVAPGARHRTLFVVRPAGLTLEARRSGHRPRRHHAAQIIRPPSASSITTMATITRGTFRRCSAPAVRSRLGIELVHLPQCLVLAALVPRSCHPAGPLPHFAYARSGLRPRVGMPPADRPPATSRPAASSPGPWPRSCSVCVGDPAVASRAWPGRASRLRMC